MLIKEAIFMIKGKNNFSFIAKLHDLSSIHQKIKTSTTEKSE